ncbi:MAG: hypothetical protein Q8L54_15950 [Devosia sp.]|nr:hypothetical protein [Devosia sp.]
MDLMVTSLGSVQIAGLVVAAILLIGGLIIVWAKQKGGWGPRNIQAFGLVLLLPTVVALATLGVIDGPVVATLLGGIAGYVLGGRFSPSAKDKE